MADEVTIDVPSELAATAAINPRRYRELAKEVAADPLSFWREQGRRLDWYAPFTHLKDVSFDAKDLHIRWYYDGTLNASFNCLDRHLEKRGNQTAIIWEGDDPSQSRHVTYREL